MKEIFKKKEPKEKVELTEEQKLERKEKVKKILIKVGETVACVVAGAALVIGGLLVIGSKDESNSESVDGESDDLNDVPEEDSSEETPEN